MSATPGPRKSGRPLTTGFVIVIVLMGAGFAYYYTQASGTISSLNGTISSLNQSASSQSASLTSMLSTIATDQAKIASLNATLVQDSAMLASLNAGYSKANQTIVSLKGAVSAAASQINSLREQVAALQGITGLNESMVVVPTKSFTSVPEANFGNTTTYVGFFTANYSGYITVTFTAASDPPHEGPEIDMSYASNIHSPSYPGAHIPYPGSFYSIGQLPNTVVFAVVPGGVAILLLTSDSTPQTATITVTYYY